VVFDAHGCDLNAWPFERCYLNTLRFSGKGLVDGLLVAQPTTSGHTVWNFSPAGLSVRS
jgi:hypothetical protein